MRGALALVPACALLAGCSGLGISVGHSSKDARTLLEKAAEAGDLAEVQRLLASGADPNERGGMVGCPLYSAVLRNHNGAVIRALISTGANPNGRGDEGSTCWASPLLQAASMGDLENTRTLLDSGAVISQSRCSKLVVGWLKPPVIGLLVQHGLDIFRDRRARP